MKLLQIYSGYDCLDLDCLIEQIITILNHKQNKVVAINQFGKGYGFRGAMNHRESKLLMEYRRTFLGDQNYCKDWDRRPLQGTE